MSARSSKKAASRALRLRRWFNPHPGFLIFAAALLLRLACLLPRQASPFFAAPELDQLMHHTWAQAIAAGDVWGHEAFFRAPLYYYWLAAIYSFFGPNLLIPRLIQILLGAASAWMVYRLGRRLYSPRVGVLAGLLYACCGPLIYHEGELYLESLLLPLLLWLLIQLHRQGAKPTAIGFLGAGMILGLAAITRPNILAFVPLVCVWIFWILRGRPIWMASFVGGSLLIIAPITIRNYIVSEDLVFIASQSGVNFYIGNNLQADGYTAIVPGTPGDWQGGYQAAIRLAETAAGRRLKPSEVSHYWTARAFREMSRHPWKWAKLILWKARLLFAGAEIGNNEDIYYQRCWSPLLQPLLWKGIIAFPFGLLLPLAALGLMLNFHWKRDALLILYCGSYVATIISYFVCSRFRLPLYPPLLLWAAVGICELVERTRSRSWKGHLIPLILSLALMLAVNGDPLAGKSIPNFEGAYYLGNKYVSLKQYDRALRAFDEAIGLNPNSSEARHGRGVALLNLGRRAEAIAEFERTADQDHRFIPARNNLAMLRQEDGQFAEAERLLSEVVALDSSNSYARRGLADVALAQKKWSLAEERYRRAYDLGAVDNQLLSRWAQALLQQGKYAEALQVNAKLLTLEPNNSRAHHNQARIYVACDSLEQAQRELEIVLRLAPGTDEAREQLKQIQKAK